MTPQLNVCGRCGKPNNNSKPLSDKEVADNFLSGNCTCKNGKTKPTIIKQNKREAENEFNWKTYLRKHFHDTVDDWGIPVIGYNVTMKKLLRCVAHVRKKAIASERQRTVEALLGAVKKAIYSEVNCSCEEMNEGMTPCNDCHYATKYLAVIDRDVEEMDK